jgi:L-lactate dehydrogenase complex protein LldG
MVPEAPEIPMSSRDRILAAIRANRPEGAFALPDVPLFDDALPPRIEAFKKGLALYGGETIKPGPGETVPAIVTARFPAARLIRSAVPDLPYPAVDAVAHPRDLADVDVAVVRAAFGVAETGSVYLSETEMKLNAIAYLAQHLVILLDPAKILGNLHHAYHRPEFHESGYAVLMTGPSATADIEGVLIRGAQGVRSLIVILTA